jgi:hypothetical protein
MENLSPIRDADFVRELAIMLKLAPGYMIKAMQSKLPHERDQASEVLAQYLVGKLAESRVRCSRLPSPPPFGGGSGWSGSD